MGADRYKDLGVIEVEGMVCLQETRVSKRTTRVCVSCVNFFFFQRLDGIDALVIDQYSTPDNSFCFNIFSRKLKNTMDLSFLRNEAINHLPLQILSMVCTAAG